ncbi:MAG: beta-galactosidase [Akkermansia sp.]
MVLHGGEKIPLEHLCSLIPGKVQKFAASAGAGQNTFLLDGRPYQIRSGELHPQRIPRSLWGHYIRSAKAMGLNTISVAVCWNLLEREEGIWDETGMNDIGAFIDLCAAEKMWVLVRPGPYVGADWDFGGLPSYLLREGPTELRCVEGQRFMAAQNRYLQRIAAVIAPRVLSAGGPVLMVQLDNELGAYASRRNGQKYLEHLATFWRAHQAPGCMVIEGALPPFLRYDMGDIPLGLDSLRSELDAVAAKQMRSAAPLFSGFTCTGRARYWGDVAWLFHPTTEASLRWYMEKGISFNLYMMYGGTNYGLAAGAHGDPSGKALRPLLTSYDYAAPLSEEGRWQPEYTRYRDLICSYFDEEYERPSLPPPVSPGYVKLATPPEIQLQQVDVERLWYLAGTGMAGVSEHPRTLESLRQHLGIGIYLTTLPAGGAGLLQAQVHDEARVYLGNEYMGKLGRIGKVAGLPLPKREHPTELRLVVNTFGHLSYGAAMEHDEKGIVGKVLWNGKALKTWRMELLPLEREPGAELRRYPLPPGIEPADGDERGVYMKAQFRVVRPGGFYLNMRDWKQGYVWVNGFLLGRYMNANGSPSILHCPVDILRHGMNRIVVLDVAETDAHPIYYGKSCCCQ